MRLVTTFALCLLLPGCASTDTGKRFWNPATWFSGSAGAKVEKLEARADGQREAVVRDAQKEAHKTVIALASAPDSRAVEVATRTANNTADLLDQANGSLTPADAQELRKLVSDLMSENATIRAEAEKRQLAAEKVSLEQATKLAETEKKLGAATGDLQEAFKRENALANKYRNLMFIAYGAIALVVLLGAAAIWFRLQTGGLLSAMSRSVRDADAKGLGDSIRSLFDPHLNRSEQDAIRSLLNK